MLVENYSIMVYFLSIYLPFLVTESYISEITDLKKKRTRASADCFSSNVIVLTYFLPPTALFSIQKHTETFVWVQIHPIIWIDNSYTSGNQWGITKTL